MIDLYSYAPAFGRPTATPFGVKAMILLQMADVEHRLVVRPDPRRTPKRKLPLIVDTDETVADSSFIRAHLERKYGVDLDAGLSAGQRAASLAFQRLAEESLYWAMLSVYWADDRYWPTVRETYFGHMPRLLRGVIAGQVRKKILRDADGHGMGRHTLDEQYRIGVDNLLAISDWLGDKAFMHGEAPTAVDASVGAFVYSLNGDVFATPLRETVRTTANLAEYAQRLQARFFPDTT